MNRAFSWAIGAVAVSLAVAPAQAATVVGTTTEITLVDLGSGILSGEFGFAHDAGIYGTGSAVDGAFLKKFTFDVLGSGLSAGSISTSLQGGGGITFAAVLLNNTPFDLSGNKRFGEVFDVPATGKNTLDVYYNTTAGSRFTGEVSFAAGPVPEPATWALMLLGVGFVGFAMRRQQKNNVRAAISFA